MLEPALLVGNTPAIDALREEITSAARSDAKVLITGESGTGKEVAAQLVHQGSRRAHAPYVMLSCAGLPETLLETELFGHVKGSFTGAYRDKQGILERAHLGTVFLDEVGEMSLRMQGVLLRFLETGEIQPVGSTRVEARKDVRVIAATNRSLKDLIAEKTFREDLYYRLNVIHIQMPPLRDRLADVPALALHFAQGLSRKYRTPVPTFSAEALARLSSYAWPGNVRELRNVVERVLARLRGPVVELEHLPTDLFGLRATPTPATGMVVHAADRLFDAMVKDGESFWNAVYRPFMSRDITRTDLQRIVSHGLEHTRGNYRSLVDLFNMPANDYKRFLNFLRKHECHLPFQQFRGALARAATPASLPEPVAPPLRRALP